MLEQVRGGAYVTGEERDDEAAFEQGELAACYAGGGGVGVGVDERERSRDEGRGGGGDGASGGGDGGGTGIIGRKAGGRGEEDEDQVEDWLELHCRYLL